MERSWDVIVAGLGAMGSASLWELARRGLRVLGLDRFSPPHDRGSTHGRSRIIREAYFEHPCYVPLVRRAYERWAELQRESGRTLYLQTGGLMVGSPGGALVAGARRSAREHAIPFEELSADEVRGRFPAFRPTEDMVGLLEARAGVLFPEECVAAFLALASRRGAEMKTNEPALAWSSEGDGVVVETPRGAYRAERLVLAAGSWLPRLVPELRLPLTVARQTLHWFETREGPDLFRPDRLPIALWEPEAGRIFYTFPDLGDGVKAAIHHEGEPTDPDSVRREPTAEDEAAIRRLVERFLPGAAGRLLDSRVCLYTNTPDGHFLIDRHPAHPQVLIVSPCSGHGFKFASAIGEALAELVTAGASALDLSPFALRRLLRAGAG